MKICENFSFSCVNFSTNFSILLETFANLSNKKEKEEDKTLDKIQTCVIPLRDSKATKTLL